MDEVKITYPGLRNITRWKAVVNRGIVPSTIIVEAIPETTLTSTPAKLTISLGARSVEFPDVVVAGQTLKQANKLRGFRGSVHLLDHRWRWKYGKISGIYNTRLPDGTVDPFNRKTPAELATLCLREMGEQGFSVARMPTGMFPPINWDKTNPAQALDKLCRYVGCEVVNGHLGRVEIWPIGTGRELPTGKLINPPFTVKPQDKPKSLEVQGGRTVFQSRLSLAAVGRNDVATLPLATLAPYSGSITESPFSLPEIENNQQRTDAFQSLFKWFYTNAQADGTHVLPGCNTYIRRGTQYRMLGILIDTWLNSDNVRLAAYPSVIGKFWPYGDDADEQTDIIVYNGLFAMDESRNLVQFPFPVWNLDSAGAIKAPELYLYTAYHVRSALGEFDTLKKEMAIGGTRGARVLHRPEIFYSVKHLYDNANQIANTVSTLDHANAEAQAYLTAFARTYTDGDQRDVEWASLENVSLDGRIAQIRYQGGVHEPFLMRASRMSEFDIYGPSAQDQRRTRFVDSLMERPDATA